MLKIRKQSFAFNQDGGRRHERGLQLVEAALVMPIMIVLLGSVAEFGRYFHMRSTMLRATMTGAVYMSDKANTNTEQLAARNMAACGQPTSCTAAQLLYPGVTNTNMTVNFQDVTSLVNGVSTLSRYVTVATSNVIYRPVFSMSKMTNNPKPWVAIPVNVSTRVRYFGS